MNTVESVFKKYVPDYPIMSGYVDEADAKKFEDEKRTGIQSALFGGMAILISCLGLFALAAYTAENRIKEIGIRKVLGASVSGITLLLSRDFVKLVVISFVIACSCCLVADEQLAAELYLSRKYRLAGFCNYRPRIHIDRHGNSELPGHQSSIVQSGDQPALRVS